MDMEIIMLVLATMFLDLHRRKRSVTQSKGLNMSQLRTSQKLELLEIMALAAELPPDARITDDHSVQLEAHEIDEFVLARMRPVFYERIYPALNNEICNDTPDRQKDFTFDEKDLRKIGRSADNWLDGLKAAQAGQLLEEFLELPPTFTDGRQPTFPQIADPDPREGIREPQTA